MATEPQKQEIKLEYPAHLRAGVYSNQMMVAHTREEFILDFLMLARPASTVVSRVIMSPGHVKRMIQALQENLKRYESQHGSIKPAEERPMGFVKPDTE